jgi:RNA-directed DNA polymerase
VSHKTPTVTSWQDIPWHQVEAKVHALQRRIYRAEQRGQRRKVKSLQRLLLRSTSAKLLAVRRVTQDNQGKKTPGVDGMASLGPPERCLLVQGLNLGRRAQPVRRVWIPKPGTQEKRPLGIPTLSDRAAQALVKLALEPQWEARFEPNSYGFRPGRSCHDAIEAIFQEVRHKPKYVLDADIAKCFDRIDHRALLDKTDTFPLLRRLIKGWLKAGVMDGGELFPTQAGTPQGGVLSPLLANIALHGLEEVVAAAFPRTRRVNGKKERWTPAVIRYADDFVVLHPDLDVVTRCREVIGDWLRGMGLELKPSKTSISHTLQEYEGKVGFDFLGFTVRQFRVGKHHTGKNGRGRPLGFKTLIKPSKRKVQAHHGRLRGMIRAMRTAPQEVLIAGLNPVIRGWTNYYRTVVSKAAFSKLDDRLYSALRRWARRRHPGKPVRWVVARYWRLPRWDFGTKDAVLAKHKQTRVARHVKVQGVKSPYDGDWLYWSSRWGHYPKVSPALARLLKRQQGWCACCQRPFLPGDDLIERHHKDGDRTNNHRSNFELLHRHCHDAVHRQGRPARALDGRFP